MSGVIDANGQQWEHCNGCTKFVKIQDLAYEKPSEKHRHGRDLCMECFWKVVKDPDVVLEPDPEAVAAHERAAAEAKAWADSVDFDFIEQPDGSWQVVTTPKEGS